MAAIHNLPEEVLLLIFKQLTRPNLLSKRDLLACQRVCRAWYSPALILLLKVIKLKKASTMRKFIAFLDHNPNPKYLSAVKELRVSNIRDFLFSKEVVHKLLFSFSNLTKVTINCQKLIAEFTDEMCKELLVKCPKLAHFEVDWFSSSEYRTCDLLYKVRPLLTTIHLSTITGELPHGETIIGYLSNFRLSRHVWGATASISHRISLSVFVTNLVRKTRKLL